MFEDDAVKDTAAAPAQDTQKQEQKEDKNPIETPEQKAMKERHEKVSQMLDKLKNVYWAISTNVPQEIQALIPDFKKENEEAKTSIDAWDKFKKEPNENNYKTFVDAFSKYGEETTQTSEQVAYNAVEVQNISESISKTFGDRLNNKLAGAKKQSYYNNVLETYYHQPQMKF